ncbi:MAG: nicotinamidase [Candidatus Kaelpia imicola]|nr:nicotinamidase [Candidatus Kaelpia imicola]
MDFKKALFIVDVQNDFCFKGALAVKGADEIIPALNKYITLFQEKKYSVFASRDWHPQNSQHFKDFGGLWPLHCVQGTEGAKFYPDLKLPQDIIIISSGMGVNEDGYSAFEGRDSKDIALEGVLRGLGIEELYIGGIATDYCVKATTLDALRLGFKVMVLTDGIKGVNIERDDSRKALDEMVSQGASLIDFKELETGWV